MLKPDRPDRLTLTPDMPPADAELIRTILAAVKSHLGDNYSAHVECGGAHAVRVAVTDGARAAIVLARRPFATLLHDTPQIDAFAHNVVHEAARQLSLSGQPSRVYTQEERHRNSPLLAACAASYMTEAQTINKLAEENARLLEDIMRHAMLRVDPPRVHSAR